MFFSAIQFVYSICNFFQVVGNSDINDKYIGSYGAQTVTLYAPGENILSTVPVKGCKETREIKGVQCKQCSTAFRLPYGWVSFDNGHYQDGYHYKSGTSFATAMVTGVAALLLAVNPNLSASQIKSAILNNVDIPNINGINPLQGRCVTNGRLNAFKAVASVAFKTSNVSGGISIDGFIEGFTALDNANIILPEEFAPLGSTLQQRVVAIKNFAFTDHSNLFGITIPNSVTNLSIEAFHENTLVTWDDIEFRLNKLIRYIGNQTSYTVHSFINIIDNFAFKNTQISQIIIPSNVTFIEPLAFNGSKSLSNIYVDENNNYYSSIDGVLFDKYGLTLIAYPQGRLEFEYRVPLGTQTIKDFAFKSSTLYFVFISLSVKNIEINAFEGSGLLKAIYVDVENQYYSAINGVLYDKNRQSLIKYPLGRREEDYIIPFGVTSIHDSAFYGNAMIRNIVLPDSIIHIGNDAFKNCANLTEINIPCNVISIGTEAFFGCHSLTEITLPDSVNIIGDNAFSNCSNLKVVLIKRKYSQGGIIELSSDTIFNNCDNLYYVVLPDIETLQMYKENTHWSKYANKMLAWGYPIFEPSIDLEEYSLNLLDIEIEKDLVVAIDVDLMQQQIYSSVTTLPAQNIFLTLLYDKLLNIDNNGKLYQGLATSVQIDMDQIYTFTLREDVPFSNGYIFSAEHVLYTIENFKDMPNTAAYRIWGQVEHVEIFEDNLLQIYLKAPNPSFLYELTLPIAGIINQHVDEFGFYYGTGAFILSQIEGNKLIFVRNENWWAGLPPSAKIILRYEEKSEVRTVNFLLDVADIAFNLTKDDIEYLEYLDFCKEFYINEMPALLTLMFNMEAEKIQNNLIREAIAYAINYVLLEYLAELYFGSNTFWDLARREFDVDKAREIIRYYLALAGILDDFEYTLNIICDVENLPILNVLKYDLPALGFNLSFTYVDKITEFNIHGHEIVITNIGLSFLGTYDFLTVYDYMKYLNFKNEEIYEVLEQKRSEQNYEYLTYFLANLLHFDLPMITLGFKNDNVIYASNCNGVVFLPDGTLDLRTCYVV